MTSARSRLRPRSTPTTTPVTEPTMKPRIVSSIVAATCNHRGPSAVPSVTQMRSCSKTPEGWPKKNLSTNPIRVVSSQLPIHTTAVTRRSTCTRTRRRRWLRRRWAAGSSMAGTATGGGEVIGATDGLTSCTGALIAQQHLVSEVTPDLFVDLGEAWFEADLGDVWGARQVDGVVRFDRPRAGRQDEHPVGEGDRLLEVVGHEDHRRRRGGPHRQQLVLHQ